MEESDRKEAPPEVAVIGTIFVDVKGIRSTFPATMKATGAIRINHGGVGRNVAENLGWLGVETGLIALTADNESHRMVAERLDRAGVRLAAQPVADGIGWFVAILDQTGKLLASVGAPPALEMLAPVVRRYPAWLTGVKLLVLEMGMPEEILEYALEQARQAGVPVMGLPTRMNLVGPRVPYLRRLDCLVLNHQEAGLILGQEISAPAEAREAVLRFAGEGIARVVITLGPDGVVAGAPGMPPRHFAAVPAEVVDTTGAGDALAAGLAGSLARGMRLEAAIAVGLELARRTVEVPDTVRAEPARDLMKLVEA